ncbi:MAG: AI-2E family transporter [Halobacteriota archaeon]
MDPRKAGLAAFGLGLAVFAAYSSRRFVPALTVAVFVFYSTRPVYRELKRFHLPRRVRATLAILFLGLPLIFLIAYTVLLLLSELRVFAEEYPVMDALRGAFETASGIEDLPELTPSGLLSAYQAGELDGVISFVSENLSAITGAVSSFLLNTLIVVVATYYLLIDGHNLKEWLLKFDDGGVLEKYFETADRELQTVLFGNLLTVIVISGLAITVFVGYNAVVPEVAEVPFPALAGALTGVASLVPVVGMKIVYVPLALAVAVNTYLAGEPRATLYVAAFVGVTVVVVDTIPDFFLRPYLSGKYTHVGLLLLAYVFGTVVFGFHGLFLAPIVLVLGLTFVHFVLPYVLGESPEASLYRPEEEKSLDDFLETEEDETSDRAARRFMPFFRS